MSQILSFAFIALGLSLSGYFLGSGLQFFKTGFQRSVTVKGIAQKTVESDILKVDIRFWEEGDNALHLRKKAAEWEKIVLSLLEKEGVKKEDIITTPADLKTKMKSLKDPQTGHYYEREELQIEQTIKIISSELVLGEKLKNTIHPDNLGDHKYNLNLQYEFTNIDSIRPEMIAASLKSAQKAADEFAKASGVKIGKISKAQQGRFTITSPSASDEYDPNEAYSKAKKVRVISNVTFDLE